MNQKSIYNFIKLSLIISTISFSVLMKSHATITSMAFSEDELSQEKKKHVTQLINEIKNLDYEIEDLIRFSVVGEETEYLQRISKSLDKVFDMSPECLEYNSKVSASLAHNDVRFSAAISDYSQKLAQYQGYDSSYAISERLIGKLIAFYKSCKTIASLHITEIPEAGIFSQEDYDAMANYMSAVNDRDYVPVKREKPISKKAKSLESNVDGGAEEALEKLANLKYVRESIEFTADLYENARDFTSALVGPVIENLTKDQKEFTRLYQIYSQLDDRSQLYVGKVVDLSKKFENLNNVMAKILNDAKIEAILYPSHRVSE